MIQLMLVAFFLEVGLALLLVPWSSYWDRNYFIEAMPSLEAAMTNNFVRGAVSGLGVINVYAGIAELVGLFAAQRRGEHILTIGRPSAE